MDTHRELHLYYRDGHSRLEVTDSDKQTILYTVHRASSKPHLTIFRAPTPYGRGFIIAQVSFHHFSSAINLDVPAPVPPLAMRKTSKLSSNYEVHGRDINWRWERDGAMTSNIRLVDCVGGGVLARFENASFSTKKQGTLIVWGRPSWEVLDAIIITGLAKVEYQRRSSAAVAGGLNAANLSAVH